MAANKRSGKAWRSPARGHPDLRKALKQLARRVRELRHELEMTQEALASASSLDAKHVQMIEQAPGNPTLASLTAVARGLGVGLDELFRPR
jgi:transcriptional regulator with XRE-family HTH domain